LKKCHAAENDLDRYLMTQVEKPQVSEDRHDTPSEALHLATGHLRLRSAIELVSQHLPNARAIARAGSFPLDADDKSENEAETAVSHAS
jgi:hypothetical protein